MDTHGWPTIKRKAKKENQALKRKYYHITLMKLWRLTSQLFTSRINDMSAIRTNHPQCQQLTCSQGPLCPAHPSLRILRVRSSQRLFVSTNIIVLFSFSAMISSINWINLTARQLLEPAHGQAPLDTQLCYQLPKLNNFPHYSLANSSKHRGHQSEQLLFLTNIDSN